MKTLEEIITESDSHLHNNNVVALTFEEWQTLKAAVEIDNSAQQLKAKIAAVADRIRMYHHPTWAAEFKLALKDLRQLSAV